MEVVQLDITLELPEVIKEKAIVLAKSLAGNEETIMNISRPDNIPHITIHYPGFPEKNIPKVLKTVKEVASRFPPVTCRTKGILTGRGTITIEFQKTLEFQQLHDIMIRKTDPLREGILRKKYAPGTENFKVLTKTEQELFKRYGSRDVYEKYKPHLSLVRFRDESLAEIKSKELAVTLPEFKCKTMAVYRMGAHGTCKEIIDRFPLRLDK